MNGALQGSRPVAPAALRLRLAGEDDRADLDAFVVARGGSPYHLARFREMVRRLYGHPVFCILAEDGAGEVRGMLPLVHIRSRLFGSYMVSLPYVNDGGALAEGSAVEEGMMRRAAELAEERGASHVEFRECQPRAGWPVRTDKVRMVLELPADPQDLWRAIGTKRRAQINRAEREGTRCVAGGAELLDDFYRVFAENMRDLGTPVYPKAMFSELLLHYRSASLLGAYIRGRPVAAGFLLGDGERVEIPWSSSLREVGNLGVNTLLYWTALKRSIEEGFHLFDFGRSTVDSGTFRFKRQWGAEPRQLYWHYWLKPGTAMPGLTPSNPKYALAIAMWRRLPVSVATRIGPFIVKGLP